MAEYTLKYINHRAECDAEAFVNDCEEHYHRQLHLVADQIAANCKRKPVVLLNGPSSSGKTTTNDRLGRILELAGIHAHMISMDDYYRTSGTYDIPFDEENGVNDLESPECMDLERLSSDLKRLAAGEEVSVPRFDFETRTSIPHDRTLQLGKDEVIMIEADGRRLWRVLENLYNNAFKYALEGTRVYVTIEDHGADVVFTIKNVSANPLNISPDELTERFVRGDVSRTTEGSGLGLSIAKDLTTLQGGKFELIIDGDLFKAQITFPIKN